MSNDAVIGRVRTLDGVRGTAILLVLFHNLDLLQSPATKLAQLTDLIFDRGWVGVQLFFVLSGFLITTILLKSRSSENYFSAFYMRRILRIFPLYYLTIITFLMVLPTFSAAVAVRLSADPAKAWLWVFLSNWFDPTSGGTPVFPHFWSLAVEEQFYLLWPAVILMMPPRRILNACMIMIFGALAIRTALLANGASYETVYMNTFCRMDALAVGAAIAIAQSLGMLARMSVRCSGYSLLLLVTIGGVVTHGFPRTTPMGQTLGYFLLSVICGLFLQIALRIENSGAVPSRILQSKLLTTFGKYSFGIYVLHMPIHAFIGVPLVQRWGNALAGSLAFSILYTILASFFILLIASIVFHVVEKPFLDLKGRFTPSKVLS
jgi:peptidoglycan/LPS O-acetylase OafA/YrhL